MATGTSLETLDLMASVIKRRLSLSIKLRVYLALVQSVLLYASETWTLTVADSKSLRRIPHNNNNNNMTCRAP